MQVRQSDVMINFVCWASRRRL